MACPLSNNVINLSYNDVLKCLENHWLELTNVTEKALSSYSAGDVIQRVRSTVPVPRHHGMLYLMPAYSSADDALAAKLITVYPQNKAVGLPSIQGIVLLFDASTGTLRAVMDGQVITNMRTAAASVVATKLLAKNDSKILTILGAGKQAQSHYQALSFFYKFDKIKVWNISKESALKLAKEIQQAGYSVECYDTVQDAVRDADIIVTATMAEKPIVEKEWIKPGAHINAVGAPTPTWQELSEDLMKSSVVYVDSREGALKESGDIIQSKADIYAEIGEVILGKKQAFPQHTTVFKSLGMAVEDVMAAKLVLELYEKEMKK